MGQSYKSPAEPTPAADAGLQDGPGLDAGAGACTSGLSTAQLSALGELSDAYDETLGRNAVDDAVAEAEGLTPLLDAFEHQQIRDLGGRMEEHLRIAEALRDQTRDAVADARPSATDCDTPLLDALSREARGLDTYLKDERDALRKSKIRTPHSVPAVPLEGEVSAAVMAGAHVVADDVWHADMVTTAYQRGPASGEDSAAFGERLGATLPSEHGLGQRFIIGLLLSTLSPDEVDLAAITALCGAAGTSTAEFFEQLAPAMALVDDAALSPEDQIADLELVLPMMATISERIDRVENPVVRGRAPHDPFAGTLQLPSGLKGQQSAGALAAMIRIHNRFADHFAALDTILSVDEGTAPEDTYRILHDTLISADREWASNKTFIVGTVDAVSVEARANSTIFEAYMKLANLEDNMTDALQVREADTLIELSARSILESNPIDAPDEVALWRRVVEAAEQVARLEEAVGSNIKGIGKGGLGLAKLPGVGPVLKFEAAISKTSSLSEIKAAAEKHELISKESAGDAKALSEAAKSCSEAAAELLEGASGRLSKHSSELMDMVNVLPAGESELTKLSAVAAAERANELSRAASRLGSIGVIGDVIGGITAAIVLLDDSASDDERADAWFDLAGATTGVGATALEAAGVAGAGGAGAALGLGIAYVQLLRSEFAKIAALEGKIRDRMLASACKEVIRISRSAMAATARAASASQLFADATDVASGTTGKGFERYIQHVRHATAKHGALLDTIEGLPGDLTNPYVGADGSQGRWLLRRFRDAADMGPAYIREAQGSDTVEDKDKYLAEGAADMFRGVAAVGEGFLILQGDD